jgi:tetratricopeptide (TPR) repeat protein
MSVSSTTEERDGEPKTGDAAAGHDGTPAPEPSGSDPEATGADPEATGAAAEPKDTGVDPTEPLSSAGAASPPSAARGSASATTTKKRRTAGERLAAARAAKAAAKTAQRGRTAEAVELQAEQRAARASDWLRARTRWLLGIAGTAVLVIAGIAIWRGQAASSAEDASESLFEAVRTARAPIRGEGQDDPTLDDPGSGRSFGDRTARAEAALEAFQGVDASGNALVWAALGEGVAALELGRPDDARTAFERALREGGDDPVVAWRALEGIVFSYEAEEAWDDALGRLEELAATGESDVFDTIADYHAARLRLAKGNRDQARTDLQELVASLPAPGGRPGPDQATGDDGPSLAYVRREAQRLLDALGGPDTPDAADAAEGVRRALEQLQKKNAAGAGDTP